MIKINLDKAKNLTHEIRREAREKELKPWDIKATIPAEAENAEAERQKLEIIMQQYKTILMHVIPKKN